MYILQLKPINQRMSFNEHQIPAFVLTTIFTTDGNGTKPLQISKKHF